MNDETEWQRDYITVAQSLSFYRLLFESIEPDTEEGRLLWQTTIDIGEKALAKLVEVGEENGFEMPDIEKENKRKEYVYERYSDRGMNFTFFDTNDCSPPENINPF